MHLKCDKGKVDEHMMSDRFKGLMKYNAITGNQERARAKKSCFKTVLESKLFISKSKKKIGI